MCFVFYNYFIFYKKQENKKTRKPKRNTEIFKHYTNNIVFVIVSNNNISN